MIIISRSFSKLQGHFQDTRQLTNMQLVGMYEEMNDDRNRKPKDWWNVCPGKKRGKGTGNRLAEIHKQ